MSLLAVEGLRVRLPTPAGDVTVVDGVDYEVQPGEVFGVAGESGSGKTMSMLALLGLLPEGAEVEGTARFGDDDLLSMPRRRLRSISGRDLAMVFQDPITSLHPMLSVGRQLTEHVRLHLGLDRAARGRARDRAAHRGAHSRSARGAPPLPAPVLGRDAPADRDRDRARVQAEAADRRRADDGARRDGAGGHPAPARPAAAEHDLAVVLITHDLGVMSAIADRVSIFYAGRVVESGEREDVLQPPRHPYTRALLDALPHPEAPQEQDLVAIPGAPPTPGRIPPGCAFHPRCAYVREDCRTEVPPLVPVGDRLLACPVDPFGRMSALELTDVVVDYERRGGRVRAVAGASLAVERGQVVGLVGESGCGKSTLARAAVGLVPASSGTVVFEGHAVTPLRRRARPAELVRLQLVFQNPYSSLNPRRTVGSQVGDGLARGQANGRVAELLELVGLPANAIDRYPHEFSGGQRQRIAIARALAADPSVIVLDEPLASLDASAQAQLANLLERLARSSTSASC